MEWEVTEEDFSDSSPLTSIRTGQNDFLLHLRTPQAEDWTSPPLSASVSAAFVASSFATLILSYPPPEGEEEEGGGVRWPFVLNGHPFLPRHAELALTRPSLQVLWPTPGYLFKRLQYGPSSFQPFIRVQASPPIAALWLGLNDQPLAYYGMAYFVNLGGITDGAYVARVALGSPDGRHVLTAVTEVEFSVDSHQEYEEDGAGPEPSKGIVPDRTVCAAAERPQAREEAEAAREGGE
eukprot:CAMPEP_0177702548 /NCGR_PEP_ID=MMETSP0484_2-20121128/7192_1 /TAXON_ID=354590 /ORGANISM="Rhodomonas lens, Strain RHODO" /LENGTH=236 /DNA_ID=CAMNT_0019213833 /DNA_START=300 /DNA_END=1007 /DNA_ORIENTATION=-